MSTPAAVRHQTQITIPKIDTQVVNPDGTWTGHWYRIMIELLRKTGSLAIGQAAGAGVQSIINSVVVGQTTLGAGAPLSVFSVTTGAMIGVIALVDEPGGAAEPQVLVSSPFEFTAPHDGTLIVFSGKTEISRDGGTTWYMVSLVGGAIPVLITDMVRVSWTSPYPPEVTYLPIAGF